MHLYRNEKYDIKFQYGGNSNMAAIPIWRQNNMAVIMECQIIPLNTIIT